MRRKICAVGMSLYACAEGNLTRKKVKDVMESVGVMCALINTDMDELLWTNLKNVILLV